MAPLAEVVLIARSLKTNILINLAALLSIGVFLLAAVAVVTHYRDGLRAEVDKINLVLVLLDDSVFQHRPAAEPAPAVSTLLAQTHIDYALAVDRSGNVRFDQGSEGDLKQELRMCMQAAVDSGRQELCFSGRSRVFFWLQDHRLMVANPSIKQGVIAGAVGAVTSLDGLYQTQRRSQKAFVIYGAINIVILTAIGVYRLTKLYLEPLQRLARRAEDYHEDETGRIFAVRKEDNELHQLSKSLNLMLERISADRQKLRATVASLEKANTELRKAQQEVIRAEKLASVGRLSAGIAHEIGNPIGIVMGYLELLQQENGDLGAVEKRDYLRRTGNEINRINTIIRQLLDLSRPSLDGARLVNVHEIVADISEVVRFEPKVAAIDIRLNLAAQSDWVIADPNQLRQVFLNLILNAVDALASRPARDHGRLTIESAVRTGARITNSLTPSAATPLLEIAVSDNGVGIAPENIGDIFDPFYTTKEPGKGTGLGLSVSFMIIESLGGKISAVSKLGEGTTMSLTLPLCEPSGPAVAIADEAGPERRINLPDDDMSTPLSRARHRTAFLADGGSDSRSS
ncbi:MAG: ATP-binding protein [Desulfobacterales bacterium]